MQLQQLFEAKRDLRNLIRGRLEKMTDLQIMKQGKWISEKLISSDIYKRSTFIGIYISLPKEVPTTMILDNLLQNGNGKFCYVPKVSEKDGSMKMLRVYSKEDLGAFPIKRFSTFSVVEPPLDYLGKAREEALESGKLDLIIVPALAFDESRGRLGKGKGYYDRFLTNCREKLSSKGYPRPYALGIALSCQKVEKVPMGPNDQYMDEVIFAPDIDISEGEKYER